MTPEYWRGLHLWWSNGAIANRIATNGVKQNGDGEKQWFLRLRRRFRNGHKALAWAFIDHLYEDDVRIAIVEMGQRTLEQVDYLETLMIQSARPQGNSATLGATSLKKRGGKRARGF